MRATVALRIGAATGPVAAGIAGLPELPDDRCRMTGPAVRAAETGTPVDAPRDAVTRAGTGPAPT